MTFTNHLSAGKVFEAASIGSIVFDVLRKDQDATVMGITSRGIYLKTVGKWLIFLSFDPFRGPLTITLNQVGAALQKVRLGDPVHIDPSGLVFSEIEAAISTTGSEVWQPRLPSNPPLLKSKRKKRQVYFASQIVKRKSGVGLGYLLPALLDLPSIDPVPGSNLILESADVKRIQGYIRQREIALLARELSGSLGTGEGLTPCADDFISGLLLSLNRWQDQLWPNNNLRDLNRLVLGAAYERTTSLSANLIECAMLGQADERLIQSLDWMVSDAVREPGMIARLLEWGNSSGVDAFVGMTAALTA